MIRVSFPLATLMIWLAVTFMLGVSVGLIVHAKRGRR